MNGGEQRYTEVNEGERRLMSVSGGKGHAC